MIEKCLATEICSRNFIKKVNSDYVFYYFYFLQYIDVNKPFNVLIRFYTLWQESCRSRKTVASEIG